LQNQCQKLPPDQTDPVPPSSKTDPLLAIAEPVSDGGSVSVITQSRRVKNCCTTAAGSEK